MALYTLNRPLRIRGQTCDVGSVLPSSAPHLTLTLGRKSSKRKQTLLALLDELIAFKDDVEDEDRLADGPGTHRTHYERSGTLIMFADRSTNYPPRYDREDPQAYRSAPTLIVIGMAAYNIHSIVIVDQGLQKEGVKQFWAFHKCGVPAP